jgi:hypothetical protein
LDEDTATTVLQSVANEVTHATVVDVK